MASNLNIRVDGRLKEHVEQQTGENGLYDNVSEYMRSLIRNDLNQKEAWQWLSEELEEGLKADESDFIAVSAEDVINRNKGK